MRMAQGLSGAYWIWPCIQFACVNCTDLGGTFENSLKTNGKYHREKLSWNRQNREFENEMYVFTLERLQSSPPTIRLSVLKYRELDWSNLLSLVSYSSCDRVHQVEHESTRRHAFEPHHQVKKPPITPWQQKLDVSTCLPYSGATRTVWIHFTRCDY